MQIFGGGSMQEALKMKQQESCTQFEITSNLLRNLYKFNLTPVTKLVLLELTTHLNESKNGSVVFPSVGYIAEVLGIGLTAAKKAINDLIKEGLIIKSKRDKVKGNYNKYLLTKKVQNMTSEPSENDSFKKTKSDLFMITNKHEQKKEQTLTGGNVYQSMESGKLKVESEEDSILYSYAVKHNAKNIKAYISKLKETGSAKKIISESKKKRNYTQIALRNIEETQTLIQKYKDFEHSAVNPKTCAAWVNFGKSLGN